MATATVTAAPAATPKPNFLSVVGRDFKKVFSWLGNPKVQAGIVAGEALGEGVADMIDPALAGLNPLIGNWTQEIFKAESLAAAAGAQVGSSAQKTAMALSSMMPQVVQFAEANGFNPLTGTDLLTANTLLVSFIKLFTPATAAVAPTSGTPAA